MTEIDFSEEVFENEVRQAEFEKVRSKYNEENACELHRDMKNGVDICEKSGSPRRVSLSLTVLQYLITLLVSLALGAPYMLSDNFGAYSYRYTSAKY